mmetsp:Transcript_41370/g.96581  ORF Transcript_41370/g.96581 Transcript_41370/m.96581 type:complete len:207 (-) Transcript_41370:112-732(-)
MPTKIGAASNTTAESLNSMSTAIHTALRYIMKRDRRSKNGCRLIRSAQDEPLDLALGESKVSMAAFLTRSVACAALRCENTRPSSGSSEVEIFLEALDSCLCIQGRFFFRSWATLGKLAKVWMGELSTLSSSTIPGRAFPGQISASLPQAAAGLDEPAWTVVGIGKLGSSMSVARRSEGINGAAGLANGAFLIRFSWSSNWRSTCF